MSDQKLTIFHNPACSKSRETMNLLSENGQKPEVIEYLNTPPDRQSLQNLIDLGLPSRDLIRTGEAAFVEADYDIDNMSDDDIIEAICQQPGLLQRPIVVKGNKVIIGRPPTNVLEVL